MRALPSGQRRRIAEQALELAREMIAEDRLTEDQLVDMTLDELVGYLAAHDVVLDLELLEDEVRRELGPAVISRNRGRLRSEEAEERIAEQAARAVRKAAQATARETVFQMRDVAVFSADTREWDEQFYAWISVGEGVCPSCHDLHGNVFALDQWEGIGKPRDGATFCGKFCRCKLVPVLADRDVTRQRQEALRVGLEPRR